MISAVFRNAIIQLSVPDAMRGRLMGLQIAVVTGGPRLGDVESGAVAAAFGDTVSAVVTGGPRLGDVESGAVAAAFGDTVSAVSGGLACIAGALVLARLLPGFRRQRTSWQASDDPAGTH